MWYESGIRGLRVMERSVGAKRGVRRGSDGGPTVVRGEHYRVAQRVSRGVAHTIMVLMSSILSVSFSIVLSPEITDWMSFRFMSCIPWPIRAPLAEAWRHEVGNWEIGKLGVPSDCT